MKITALLENTTRDTALTPKHGLSIYIETPKHKVLFDLGPDDTCIWTGGRFSCPISRV